MPYGVLIGTLLQPSTDRVGRAMGVDVVMKQREITATTG